MNLLLIILLPSIIALPLLIGLFVLVDKLDGRNTRWFPRKLR